MVEPTSRMMEGYVAWAAEISGRYSRRNDGKAMMARRAENGP
jgi:hypothetical protein